MLPNSITLKFNQHTYSNPILYGEYVAGTLYLIHPDKKIALNITPEKLQPFIESLFQNIQTKFTQSIPCFFINSFETIAQTQNYKLKKRKKLLPDSIIFIPSQKNNLPIIKTDTHVTLTPLNNPIHFDYPKPDKTKFINQISHLQKKLTKQKETINFSYTSHSKLSDQEIITTLTHKTDTLVKTPDFTLALETKNYSPPTINQNILFTENHSRNFQKGSIHLYTKDKKLGYSIDQSTNIIQTNIEHNLSLKINNQTKPFHIFKKISKAINQATNA
jgi:hypothetical protein